MKSVPALLEHVAMRPSDDRNERRLTPSPDGIYFLRVPCSDPRPPTPGSAAEGTQLDRLNAGTM